VTRARLSFIFDPTTAPRDWRVRCNVAAMDVGGFDVVYRTGELMPDLEEEWDTPVQIGVLYEPQWLKSGLHERAEHLIRRDGRPSPIARSGQSTLFEIPGVSLVGTQFFMIVDGENPLKNPVRATMICSAAQYGDCRATIPWRHSTSVQYIFGPMTLDDDRKKVDPRAFIELDRGIQATLSELVRPPPRDQRKRSKEVAGGVLNADH
jgi:hypothetical protein